MNQSRTTGRSRGRPLTYAARGQPLTIYLPADQAAWLRAQDSISGTIQRLIAQEMQTMTTTTLTYIRHQRSGDVYAVRLDYSYNIIESCGPISYRDITVANLESHAFNLIAEDAAWLNDQPWRELQAEEYYQPE